MKKETYADKNNLNQIPLPHKEFEISIRKIQGNNNSI